MKLIYRDKLIFASLLISYGTQNITVECVVDTGSAGTAIDTSQLSLDLSRAGTVADMVGIGGSHQVLIQTVELVSLDGVIVKDFPVEFGDFTGQYSVRGIIGGDLLKILGTTIDYLKDELQCHCGL